MRAICLLLCLAAPSLCQEAISPQAAAYLDAAFTVMQRHFLHKDSIDWPRLRQETLAQAAGAQTPVDTYPSLRFALARLGDHHSYLQLPPALAAEERSRGPKLANPAAMPASRQRKPSFPFPSPFRTRRVPEGAMIANPACPAAQVVVPQFAAQDRQEIDSYATRVQGIIGELASRKPRGWVLDLRGNGGGNLWAMMAGVGPLLGDGQPGASLQEDGAKGQWYYEAGRAGWRNDAKDPYYARTTAPPVHVSGTPPVAVLIDRDTGSSGEGIAIAFRGRPETRFFGEQTYGAATSTFPYPLSDGAQLYLVTGVMVDRNGNEYPDGIVPDREVLSEATISTADPVLQAAAAWIAERACKAKQK